MKKIVTIVNPILFQLKYMLLALFVMFGMLLVTQFVFQNFSVPFEDVMGNIKQTVIPLGISAAISMYLIQKSQKSINSANNS